jgi:hypothetical protein
VDVSIPGWAPLVLLTMLLLMVSFLVTWHVQMHRIQQHLQAFYQRHAVLAKLVQDLHARPLQLADAVPLTVAIQTLLVRELVRWQTPTVATLLTKLGPPYRLTAAEEALLIAALEARATEPTLTIPASEREAARMLPLVMQRLRREQALTQERTVTVYQIVSVREGSAVEAPTP